MVSRDVAEQIEERERVEDQHETRQQDEKEVEELL